MGSFKFFRHRTLSPREFTHPKDVSGNEAPDACRHDNSGQFVVADGALTEKIPRAGRVRDE